MASELTNNELRVMVAEILGRSAEQYFCPDCKINVPMWDKSVSGAGHHMPEGGCGAKLESLPNFPEDLNAAFTLIEWLRKEKGIFVRVENHPDIWEVEIQHEKGEFVNVNQSLPRAICEAFLEVFNQQPRD